MIIWIHTIQPPNEQTNSYIYEDTYWTKSLIYSIQQYPCIICPLFLLLIFVGWETQLIVFPNISPKIERTSLLKSSLIACIFLLTSATNLAAAGFSQNHDLECDRWIQFFCTSFNFRVLQTISNNLVAFSILSWICYVARERNEMCLWINSALDY